MANHFLGLRAENVVLFLVFFVGGVGEFSRGKMVFLGVIFADAARKGYDVMEGIDDVTTS